MCPCAYDVHMVLQRAQSEDREGCSTPPPLAALHSMAKEWTFCVRDFENPTTAALRAPREAGSRVCLPSLTPSLQQTAHGQIRRLFFWARCFEASERSPQTKAPLASFCFVLLRGPRGHRFASWASWASRASSAPCGSWLRGLAWRECLRTLEPGSAECGCSRSSAQQGQLVLSPVHCIWCVVEKVEASRGFEPRSLDSGSRVLTVTPRGQLVAIKPWH